MPVFKKMLISFSISAAVMFFAGSFSFASAEKTGIVTENAVNFRANPNTSSKILYQFEKGAQVKVIGSEGEWFKASYNDITGWINGNYVIIRDEKIGSGVVSGSVVNVRRKPDITSEVLAKLTKGTKVEIFEHSGDWYRVLIGEERYGWMHGDYVRIQEERVSRGGGNDSTGTAGAPEEESLKNADIRNRIVEYAKTLLGVKYVYGGSSPKGFDCSGFVSYVFKKFGITLQRTSAGMGNGGKPVEKSALKPGDLVFFDTNGGLNRINHVGIYIGDGKFIHASSYLGRKVTISSLSDGYYKKTYMRARDYLSE
ncbi:MAG: NlpC/P60 family protein [Acetivibrionales bacterium]|jgi:cell wall-associated NlpC family hydrolase